ncbi:MAG: energy transducer TonB [Fibrobacter sp.]|nr:energy transducer TonB [Fibrobacter sp.]
MSNWIKKSIPVILIVICVIVINIFLFSLFPVLHRALSSVIETVYDAKLPHETVMEFKKPQKQKAEMVKSQIREIRNPTVSGGSSRDALSFKFNPDLSVEGGGDVAMETADLSTVIFDEGETDEDLVPVFVTPVSYPNRARDLGVQGTLEAVIVVGREGRVESVKVTKSPHSSITNEALKTISGWRFKPARNKGIPVSVRVKQVIEFKLD